MISVSIVLVPLLWVSYAVLLLSSSPSSRRRLPLLVPLLLLHRRHRHGGGHGRPEGPAPTSCDFSSRLRRRWSIRGEPPEEGPELVQVRPRIGDLYTGSRLRQRGLGREEAGEREEGGREGERAGFGWLVEGERKRKEGRQEADRDGRKKERERGREFFGLARTRLPNRPQAPSASSPLSAYPLCCVPLFLLSLATPNIFLSRPRRHTA